jgi:hypothetical protein
MSPARPYRTRGGKAKSDTAVPVEVSRGLYEMHRFSITDEKFFGLVELGADGTVLYSRVEREDGNTYPSRLTGRNFFTVAPFLNVVEFRQYVDQFNLSAEPANSMPFTCEYADGPVKVKILLARIREKAPGMGTKSILVHIRKA